MREWGTDGLELYPSAMTGQKARQNYDSGVELRTKLKNLDEWDHSERFITPVQTAETTIQ